MKNAPETRHADSGIKPFASGSGGSALAHGVCDSGVSFPAVCSFVNNVII